MPDSLHDVARAALLEITAPETIGTESGQVVEATGAISVTFEAAMPGYPGWHWTVAIAQLEGEQPSVLEVELMPGEGALLSPDWVPWSDRLADYKASQEASEGELSDSDDSDLDSDDVLDDEDDDDSDESDDDDSDDDLDNDSDDDSDDSDDSDDDDLGDELDDDDLGSDVLHAGDLDGVDIDVLDDSDDADADSDSDANSDDADADADADDADEFDKSY